MSIAWLFLSPSFYYILQSHKYTKYNIIQERYSTDMAKKDTLVRFMQRIRIYNTTLYNVLECTRRKRIKNICISYMNNLKQKIGHNKPLKLKSFMKPILFFHKYTDTRRYLLTNSTLLALFLVWRYKYAYHEIISHLLLLLLLRCEK